MAKYQQCGKQGCRCKNGVLHGPYFWLVEYINKKNNPGHPRQGKYLWKYLGKNPSKAWLRVQTLDSRFNQQFELDDFKARIKELAERRRNATHARKSEPVLTIENVPL